VETQGDFIRFLIREIETAAFRDIEDVVSFVKWLDDELSYLVCYKWQMLADAQLIPVFEL